MKLKHFILGILVILCLLNTGYDVHKIQDEHVKRVAEWNEGAKAAFEKVLWAEMDKRWEKVKMVKGDVIKEEIKGSVVAITLGNGTKYEVENCKYENSLTKELSEKWWVSGLLSNYPLSIDTLTLHWDSCLSTRQIIGNSRVRYIYTDEDLNNDTVYSQVVNHTSLDSLTVSYMGIRCEHELTAFISYPHWLSGISWNVWTILILPWLLLVLLTWQHSKLENWIRHKLVREKKNLIKIEKVVYASDVPMDKANVFKLPDGTLFDPSAKCLSKGEIQCYIQPQTASLLKLFISNSEYEATDTEICRALWQTEKEKNKLYTAIRRLRNDLKAVNSDLTIVYIGGAYKLK